MKSVLEKLEHNSELDVACFEMDYVKLNFISGNKNEYMWARLDQDIVWESNDVKLLGVTKDKKLRLDKHVYFFKKETGS